MCLVLGEPSDDEAREIAAFLPGAGISELYVVGDAAMRVLKRWITDGRWQMSRQYCLESASFRPRPSALARQLGPDDRKLIEAAIGEHKVARHSSTMRDFDYMAEGRPVVCYGAFVDGKLAAFCSSNPIYTGITEISWIFTAEPYRRRGLAAGALTAACEQAFALGDVVAYFNGEATEAVYRMVTSEGFRELRPVYRFIPASCPEQWRCWGKDV
jgi:RimJ/RimL family protein N-acetyltransferase